MNKPRDYLTEQEVERLIHAAGQVGRNPHRDRTMLLMAYSHGLRVSELVTLNWGHINLEEGTIHCGRVKNGIPSVHPLRSREIRALRKIRKARPYARFVFLSERGAPLTTRAVQHIVRRAGQKAGIGWPVHPHMLRHSCGYRHANAGQDTRAIQAYLGHRSIQHTVRYTQLSPERFNNFWKD